MSPPRGPVGECARHACGSGPKARGERSKAPVADSRAPATIEFPPGTSSAGRGDRRRMSNGGWKLSPQESMRLLGSVSLGRVVFTARALPAIRPVCHLVDGEYVIIRTDSSAAITSELKAEVGPIVAYQADALDPAEHLRWGVIGVGLAHRRLATDPDAGPNPDHARPHCARPPWQGATAKPRAIGSAQLPQEGVEGLSGRQPDPGIHGGHPVRAGDDWVEVELRDFGEVVGEPGNAQHGLPQGRQGSRRGTVAAEQDRL